MGMQRALDIQKNGSMKLYDIQLYQPILEIQLMSWFFCSVVDFHR